MICALTYGAKLHSGRAPREQAQTDVILVDSTLCQPNAHCPYCHRSTSNIKVACPNAQPCPIGRYIRPLESMSLRIPVHRSFSPPQSDVPTNELKSGDAFTHFLPFRAKNSPSFPVPALKKNKSKTRCATRSIDRLNDRPRCFLRNKVHRIGCQQTTNNKYQTTKDKEPTGIHGKHTMNTVSCSPPCLSSLSDRRIGAGASFDSVLTSLSTTSVL